MRAISYIKNCYGGGCALPLRALPPPYSWSVLIYLYSIIPAVCKGTYIIFSVNHNNVNENNLNRAVVCHNNKLINHNKRSIQMFVLNNFHLSGKCLTWNIHVPYELWLNYYVHYIIVYGGIIILCLWYIPYLLYL